MEATQVQTVNNTQCQQLGSRLKAVFSRKRRKPIDEESDTFHAPQIEDYRPGYPQFSALLGSDASFQIGRRFSVVRMRLQLLKQDEVACLEEQLNGIDASEKSDLFLGSCRRDRNSERQAIISRLEKALAEYDDFLQRNDRIMRCQKATNRDVQTLRNWIEGNGCIARDESRFLDHRDDLCTTVKKDDSARAYIQPTIEDVFIFVARWLRIPKVTSMSRDKHVFIFSPSLISSVAQFLIVWLTLAMLVIPLVVLNKTSSFTHRIMVILAALAAFVFGVAVFSRARTAEVFIAGATYAAVLVVFVSADSAM